MAKKQKKKEVTGLKLEFNFWLQSWNPLKSLYALWRRQDFRFTALLDASCRTGNGTGDNKNTESSSQRFQLLSHSGPRFSILSTFSIES